MTINIDQLAAQVVPQRTVLLFGSGASIPSGAPSVDSLCAYLSETFNIGQNDYSLSELTGIIEHQTRSRAALIAALRRPFVNLKPTGGLLNLPLYPWRSIFTTNYETLIEQSYARAQKPLQAYSCNFDFSQEEVPNGTKLFKLHGTIDQDESTGHKSRMIVTEHDYELTSEYREMLYDRLKADLAGAHLIIIGHSLADPHIRDLANRAAAINAASEGMGKISLLLFTVDENRAERVQNHLLRRMISIAPAERVPRHRLIRNLLDLGDYEKAEAEIKIFKKDFSRDAPVARYEIDLMVARAIKTAGIMPEDRVARLNDAIQLAAAAVDRYANNKSILGAYCNASIAYYRLTGRLDVFDAAIAAMKTAESFVGDPDITSMIRNAERRIQGDIIELDGEEKDDVEADQVEA